MRPADPSRPDEFFDRVRDWSIWKHRLLEKYLQIWVYKLGSAYPRLAFVDTCAGPGVYADGSLGSPLIAARWNGKPVGDRFVYLDVHACEHEEGEVAALRKNLEPWLSLAPPRAIVYDAPFWDVLPDIVAATRDVPSLFFIDPFGVKEISRDKLDPLLSDKRRAPTEVIIRADPVMFARMAGWIQAKPRSAAMAKVAKTFQALLTKFNVDPAAIELASQSPEEPTGIDAFADYLELIRRSFKWVQLIPIRPSYWAPLKYQLIHGTNSAHGAAFINDAVSTNEDSLYANTLEAEHVKHGQFSLEFDERTPTRSSLAQLRDSASAVIRERGAMKFIDLRAEMAMRYGPEFREMHHKTVIQSLIHTGEVEIAGGGKLGDATILKRLGGGAV